MITYRIELHPEAIIESRESARWYAARSPAAAEAFVAEIDRAVTEVQSDPERWSIFYLGLRRYLMPTFPYAMIYRIVEDTVQILAFAHARRRPGYWKRRATAK